jgi:hypothetical protein
MLILLFVFMYFSTGFLMINHQWFPEGEPVTSLKTLPFRMDTSIDSISLGRQISREYDLRGRMDPPITLYDGRLHFFYFRPGETNKAIINNPRDSILITTIRNMSFTRVVNRIHHIRNYSGGFVYYLWACFVDLASLGMILFSLTGILIWYKSRKHFRFGWFFLGTGILITVGVIIALSVLP